VHSKGKNENFQLISKTSGKTNKKRRKTGIFMQNKVLTKFILVFGVKLKNNHRNMKFS